MASHSIGWGIRREGSLWTRNAVRGVSVAGERRRQMEEMNGGDGCPQVKVAQPDANQTSELIPLERIVFILTKRYDGKSFA